jgi:ssDNA-binding Zn-finger/Zn-ribbon topoisomerase 1
MARIVGYQCVNCGTEDEEIFNDTEERPEFLDRKCTKCGSNLKKRDIKQNCQRWAHRDRGGM